MTSTRHRWGEPDRLQFKTERECTRCGLVKVTRHEPGVLPWVEFWRACERVPGDGMPPCVISEAQPAA